VPWPWLQQTRQHNVLLKKRLASGGQHDLGAMKFLRGGETQMRLSRWLNFEVDGSIQVRVLGASDAADREPVSACHPGFRGLNPTVVGLVVGKVPRHQFELVTPAVQNLVPQLSLRAIAPFEELRAGGDVVVLHAVDPRFFAVVVPAKEIAAEVPTEEGDGSGMFFHQVRSTPFV